MYMCGRWGRWKFTLLQRTVEQNQSPDTVFKWFIYPEKQGWEKQYHAWKMIPDAVIMAQRQVLPCLLLQTVGSPLPSPTCWKKITKQNSFSSMHTRECLASATEPHSCRVSLSIKWHACPLPRKILVPNTNHAPWLPSSVYSSRTAIHPCSVWKILKWLQWIFSLTVLAQAGICSRVNAHSSQREGSALNSLYWLTPCKWRRVTVRALEGTTGRATVWEEDCQGTSC